MAKDENDGLIALAVRSLSVGSSRGTDGRGVAVHVWRPDPVHNAARFSAVLCKIEFQLIMYPWSVHSDCQNAPGNFHVVTRTGQP